jgi:hypothetical protein
MKLVINLVLLIVWGCGDSPSEVSEKTGLDKEAEEVTFDPPPGVYEYKLWTTSVKPQTEGFSRDLKVKAPSSEIFESAKGCHYIPYKDGKVIDDCIEITESGDWEYFLETFEGKSSPVKVNFTINLASTDAELTAREVASDAGVKIALSEVETFCKYTSSDKLQVLIRLKNEEKLTDERFAYMGFEIATPTSGKSYTYNQENDVEAGVQIKPVTDDLPYSISLLDYSSKAADDDAMPASSCSITVEQAKIGELNKGVYTCTGLRSWSSSGQFQNKILGNMIDITGNWQCDRYH